MKDEIAVKKRKREREFLEMKNSLKELQITLIESSNNKL